MKPENDKQHHPFSNAPTVAMWSYMHMQHSLSHYRSFLCMSGEPQCLVTFQTINPYNISHHYYLCYSMYSAADAGTLSFPLHGTKIQFNSIGAVVRSLSVGSGFSHVENILFLIVLRTKDSKRGNPMKTRLDSILPIGSYASLNEA